MIGEERNGVVLDNPDPPVQDADELVVVPGGTGEDHGPYDRVQTRAIASTGEYADTHAFMVETAGSTRDKSWTAGSTRDKW